MPSKRNNRMFPQLYASFRDSKPACFPFQMSIITARHRQPGGNSLNFMMNWNGINWKILEKTYFLMILIKRDKLATLTCSAAFDVEERSVNPYASLYI